MKVMVYNYRDFDEAMWFTKYSEELGIELRYVAKHPIWKMQVWQQAVIV